MPTTFSMAITAGKNAAASEAAFLTAEVTPTASWALITGSAAGNTPTTNALVATIATTDGVRFILSSSLPGGGVAGDIVPAGTALSQFMSAGQSAYVRTI